jgi:hypothetical protein
MYLKNIEAAWNWSRHLLAWDIDDSIVCSSREVEAAQEHVDG